MNKDSPNFVTALARGLDVLRCFSPEKQELGTTEIARLTGLAQSTVWRLCFTLQEYGCLTQGRTPDRLRIGAGVLLLGHAAITQTNIAEFSKPLLQHLAEKFDASVSLGERSGTTMVIVQRGEAANIVKVNLHVGSHIGVATSSMGLAYLCAVASEHRNELVREIKDERIDGWNGFERNLQEAQRDYRRLGFVFNLGRSHQYINAIGVPVISPDGRKVMALTCGGARSTLSRDKLITEAAPALKSLAEKIAPMLSGPP